MAAGLGDSKIVLLGSLGSGKTSLLKRYVDGVFDELGERSTIGASFALKKWCGKNFVIWDTAGQEKFDSLNNFYCRKATAAILVYDVTSRFSFDKMDKYYRMVKEASEGVFVVVVGAKYDLVEENHQIRQIDQSEGSEYARNIGAKFVECSSKTNFNVGSIFDFIGQHLHPGIDPDTYAEETQKTTTPPASPQPSMVLTNDKGQFSVFVDPKSVEQPQNQSGCSC